MDRPDARGHRFPGTRNRHIVSFGQYSDAMASRLVDLGLALGQMVLTCLSKSGWVPVIYLAVLKRRGHSHR